MKKPYKSLSEKYRGEGKKDLTPKEVDAYIEARMPATMAVVLRVLQEVPKSVKSLLDIGAGPGTATLAAKEVFPQLSTTTLIEQNKAMIGKGKELLSEGFWVEESFVEANFSLHDLLVFSYSLGEVDAKNYCSILQKAWEVGKVIVIIEPGTPRGYEVMLKARQILIELGGNVIAPCPHSKPCPLKTGWCHFGERLERTATHKKLKGGSLGWEEEKYSYVVVGKEEAQKTKARILNNPQKRKGHLSLTLCTEEGIIETTLSRKEGETYKRARKAKWGDDWISTS